MTGDVRERLQARLGTAYRLEHELGSGGMATVFLAEDVRHHRKVAIKVIHPELSAVLGPERFLKEIELTAALQHPHILPLFDSGSADGQLFYVMPYVQGETLRTRLERERQLPLADAVRIATEVADALDYAHRHHVVHRDVKPENVLLHDGHALVADFGIALAVEQAAGKRLTQTGLSLGTPHYMAPEQAMGDKAIDHRADVYALGAVTYEMLVGDPPFTGPTAQAIVAKVLTERPVPPSSVRDTVPAHVENAILTALAKLPADRFSGAASFSAALATSDESRRRVTAQRPVLSMAGRRLGMLIPWGIAGAAVIVAALAVRRTGSAPATWQTTILGDSALLPLNEPALTLSPDGTMLVFKLDRQNSSLMLKRRGELTASVIAGTERAHSPSFSPDGKSIAFISDGQLRKVPLTGGGTVALAPIVESRGIDWTDDGRIVYSSLVPPSVRHVKADGSTAAAAMLPDSIFGGLGVGAIDMLPGSRALLVVLCTAQCWVMSLHVVDLRTGRRRLLLNDVAQAWYADDGQLLYLRRDGTLLLAPFDADRLQLTGPGQPVADGVSIGPGFAQLGWSASGAMAFVRADANRGLRGVVRVDSTGKVARVDPGWSGPFHMLALSPDGRRLALWSGSATLDQNIWLKELDNGPFTKFTFGGTDRRPAWSPDGRRIAFVHDTLDHSVAMVRAADGSGGEQLVARLDRRVQEIAWSPDGSWLVFRTDNGARGVGDLVGVRTSGDTTPVPLVATPFTELTPAVSPNGRWLAYTSNESGTNEVYVRPFPETHASRWQVSVSGGSQPRWSRNGRLLYYIDGTNRLVAADIPAGGTFSVTARRPLFDVSFSRTEMFQHSYDVSPNGHFLFLAPLGPTDPNAPSRVVWADNWMHGLPDSR